LTGGFIVASKFSVCWGPLWRVSYSLGIRIGLFPAASFSRFCLGVKP